MAHHSYTRCWVHLVWGTYRRAKLLGADAQPKVAGFLAEYSRAKRIHMKTCFVNPDHVHALLDLPTGLSMQEAAKLLKGASSHWINQQRLTAVEVSWARGFGGFSVSESQLPRVVAYIENQEAHHRRKTFAEELAEILKAHGYLAPAEETVKTVGR